MTDLIERLGALPAAPDADPGAPEIRRRAGDRRQRRQRRRVLVGGLASVATLALVAGLVARGAGRDDGDQVVAADPNPPAGVVRGTVVDLPATSGSLDSGHVVVGSTVVGSFDLGTESAIRRSTDSGRTWSEVALPGLGTPLWEPVVAVLGTVVVVAADGVGGPVWVSDDEAVTFHEAQVDPGDWADYRFAMRNPPGPQAPIGAVVDDVITVYGPGFELPGETTGRDEVGPPDPKTPRWSSTDGGRTWTLGWVTPDLAEVQPLGDGLVALGSWDGGSWRSVQRSADGGETWTAAPLPDDGALDLRVVDDVAVATSSTGTWISRDGVEWSRLADTAGPADEPAPPHVLAVDADRIVASAAGVTTATEHLVVSDDGGATWAEPAGGMRCADVDPARPPVERLARLGTALVAVRSCAAGDDLVASTDGGGTWNPVAVDGLRPTDRIDTITEVGGRLVARVGADDRPAAGDRLIELRLED